MNDLEMQQYLFDLQGYLVIENALDQDQVTLLNELMDQQNLPAPSTSTRFGFRAKKTHHTWESLSRSTRSTLIRGLIRLL